MLEELLTLHRKWKSVEAFIFCQEDDFSSGVDHASILATAGDRAPLKELSLPEWYLDDTPRLAKLVMEYLAGVRCSTEELEGLFKMARHLKQPNSRLTTISDHLIQVKNLRKIHLNYSELRPELVERLKLGEEDEKQQIPIDFDLDQVIVDENSETQISSTSSCTSSSMTTSGKRKVTSSDSGDN